MSMIVKPIVVLLAVVVSGHLLDEDLLEPSVRNEVAHAVAVAPTNAPPAASLPFPTNGLSRSQLAIRLVSAQKANGRWLVGTNDVTAAAVEILKSL